MTLRPAPAALAALAALALSAQQPRRVEPAGIPVRYPEGVAHGFLDLRTANGALLASGDLLQVPRGRGIESRTVFSFPDSSLFEETVSFTQDGVFALQAYHLVQRGPAFADDLDASLSANGRYIVKTKSHRDGRSI